MRHWGYGAGNWSKHLKDTWGQGSDDPEPCSGAFAAHSQRDAAMSTAVGPRSRPRAAGGSDRGVTSFPAASAKGDSDRWRGGYG